MKALRSFTVRPQLPEALMALDPLARDLRWSWDRKTRELFASIDPTLWDSGGHDPLRLLAEVPASRLVELSTEASFLEQLSSVSAGLESYRTLPRWYQGHTESQGNIAYFSPEFGISEALPQYSGGLGVLAGDHLKAASDLGVPLVAIGLFYRHGYFRQSLSVDGWQQERFPDLDPHAMALELCDGVRVTLDMAGQTLVAQIWKATVGRTPLYLLDADIPENPPELQVITDRLYGGDVEHRLRQEILLGIGGVRALEALDIPIQVFHTNEGHAGFLGLERIKTLMEREGLAFGEAFESVRTGSVFTTHTPVPAGIDQFPREMMERYFGGWASSCGISVDQLMDLGHRPGESPEQPFNMAVMGMHLAELRNGVSALHGEVSREMFSGLWPGVPDDEVPISSITNGVHGGTWVSGEFDELLSNEVGAEWHLLGADDWDRIALVDDNALWSARSSSKVRLVEQVRGRLHKHGLAQGRSSSELEWVEDALDPNALTICFARR
ncbi:MAG TPA: alpha-glucan family phosphorylase, partial [Microthrixaceae bacterium]|nr:alpha-glucan family phosphorylase [Microthrixaceae bacterium]